jgi:hypothetical protein
MAARRPTRVPRVADAFLGQLSKSDLIEMVWALASIANDAGSCDDDDSTLRRLVEEARAHGAVSEKRARALGVSS